MIKKIHNKTYNNTWLEINVFIYELQSKWQQLLPYFHDIFCGLCTNAAHYQYFEKKFIEFQ